MLKSKPQHVLVYNNSFMVDYMAMPPPAPTDTVVEVTGEESDLDRNDAEASLGGVSIAAKKKKKKPKKKKKVDYAENGGGVPPEECSLDSETVEQSTLWESELKKGARTYHLDPWFLLQDRERPKLNLFRTPGCTGVALRTRRLILRQVQVGDTTAIRRIKMEPIVQRTQLYGSPGAGDIKESFQRRYIASSIPRLEAAPAWRDEYVFAITAKDPSVIAVAPAGSIRVANRISVADGYLGNIALSLEAPKGSPDETLRPTAGQIYRHPTLAATAQAGLTGKMFYELHPQLWGQGLVSEAFAEVLRFAIEEVGCLSVSADPTEGNAASIRLCVKHGMTLSHETTDNAFGMPQLFHTISRAEWWKRNREGKQPVGKDGPWGGKETCRWCCDFRKRAGIACGHCGWAKYCSRECQRADWVYEGGHQSECT